VSNDKRSGSGAKYLVIEVIIGTNLLNVISRVKSLLRNILALNVQCALPYFLF
jgi:hypothetical protein